MYTLNVGLGYSIFVESNQIFSDYYGLFSKIKQHRIILSEALVKYYLDSVPDEYYDVLNSYLNDIIVSDDASASFADDPSLDAQENLIKFVMQVPMRVLVTEADEFKDYNVKKIKVVTPLSIKNHENNAFNRYTFPITNEVAHKDEDCESYSVWFGHLFENENSITIIDPYILTTKGMKSLDKYYLTHIPKDSEVNIYCEHYDCNENLQEFQKRISILKDRGVHVYLCRDMHDRYILLESIQIALGIGLDFLDVSGKIRKNCNISITTDSSIPLPEVNRQLF